MKMKKKRLAMINKIHRVTYFKLLFILSILVVISGCSREPIIYDNELMMWVKNKRVIKKYDDVWPGLENQDEKYRTENNFGREYLIKSMKSKEINEEIRKQFN